MNTNKFRVDYASLKALVEMLEVNRLTMPDMIVLEVKARNEAKVEGTLEATVWDTFDNGPLFVKDVMLSVREQSGRIRSVDQKEIS